MENKMLHFKKCSRFGILLDLPFTNSMILNYLLTFLNLRFLFHKIRIILSIPIRVKFFYYRLSEHCVFLLHSPSYICNFTCVFKIDCVLVCLISAGQSVFLQVISIY